MLGVGRLQFRLALRTADGVASGQDAGDQIVGRDFGITPDLEPAARNRQGTAGAVEEQPAHALTAAAGGAFAELANGGESRVFNDGVLAVGHLAVILKEKTSTAAVN